jgi:hypothetical protein
MIDAATTEAFWSIIHDYVQIQKNGERVLATEVHAELMEFLASQDIVLPAAFEGASVYEVTDIFVDGSAIFVTNSFPELGPELHTHPIFIECLKGGNVDSQILEAFPQLATYFTNSFCHGEPRAADAAEVETESAPAGEELFQHFDVAAKGATGTGWAAQSKIELGAILDLGDDRVWRVTRVYDGFLLNKAQLERLPPQGYITETFH